jgi:hypothetical protein
MTHLERRLARLEAIRGNADDLIEREPSEEAKALLRETWAGLYPPEEIERIVRGRCLVRGASARRPRSTSKKSLRPSGRPSREMLKAQRRLCGSAPAMVPGSEISSFGDPARDRAQLLRPNPRFRPLTDRLHSLSSKRTPPITAAKPDMSKPEHLTTHTFFCGVGDD